MKPLVLNSFMSVWTLLILFFFCFRNEVETKFTHTQVHRTLNLGTRGSNIVYDKLEMELINSHSEMAENYIFQVPKSEGKVIRLKAYQNEKKEPLEFIQTMKKDETTVFTIAFKSPIPVGQNSKLKIIFLHSNRLKPLPESISQEEDQFLVYEDTFAYNLDGPCEEFLLTTELPDSMKPLDFSKVDPYQVNGKTIKFGPYKKDMTSVPFRLHFRSQQMGLTLEKWRREVWIRNYGSTLEFEDHIDIVHKGAKFKGSFSRLGLMQGMHRKAQQPIIEMVELRLPPGIRELYYRDDTGNVSTSLVNYRSDMTQFLVKPRYVLFGGWKYNWYHGFSMSSTSMLKTLSNGHFILMFPTVHPFSNPDVVAQQYSLTIVLPESAQLHSVHMQGKNIPYLESTTYYYLDTTGRLTLHLNQVNVFCNKPDLISIQYTLPTYAYYQKPAVATGALFLILISIPILRKIFIGSKKKH